METIMPVKPCTVLAHGLSVLTAYLTAYKFQKTFYPEDFDNLSLTSYMLKCYNEQELWVLSNPKKSCSFPR